MTTRAIVLALKTQQRGPLEIPFETIEADGDERRARPGDRDQAGLEPALPLPGGEQAEADPHASRWRRGAREYPTPLGKFEVVNKQLDPWWYPPAGSAWAEGAKPIPPGPGNPLGTRWMGLSAPYVGIHGTPDAASIGYSASHGCIRMLIPQVEWLFTQVDVGTPVFIVAA